MERQIALEILLKFKQDKSYLNLTINAYFNRYDLTRQQKDFITRVVYGTVQNMLLLEYILKPHLHMRVKTYEKMLLLMSLYQHEMMDSIPDYAIINEAVELAKKKKGMKTARFIHAILQKTFQSSYQLDDLPPLERISIETSHPLWLVKIKRRAPRAMSLPSIVVLPMTTLLKSAMRQASPYKVGRLSRCVLVKPISLKPTLQ